MTSPGYWSSWLLLLSELELHVFSYFILIKANELDVSPFMGGNIFGEVKTFPVSAQLMCSGAYLDQLQVPSLPVSRVPLRVT